jgi:predicted dehydrogenase
MKTTRRGFLRRSGGVAAVLGFPTLVPARVLGAGAPSNRITMGMIGVGSHGTGVNLKGFLAQPDAQVVAVCDVDTTHLANARKLVNAKYGDAGCAATKDFREILARTDIDAVMISTPDHWHVPIAMAALRAGKDVCCEKPTLTLAEGRMQADLVRRCGAVFQTSTEDRGVAVYHRMAELVRNGRIGRVHTVRVGLPTGPKEDGDPAPQPVPPELDYEMWLGPAPWAPYTRDRVHYNFRWILDYSVGMIADWGTHLFDTAQWALDVERSGPVEIDGRGVFMSRGLYNTAREFRVEYLYANGVRMIAENDAPYIRFEGDKGWVGNRGWRGPLQAEPASILGEVIGPGETHLFTCPAGEHRNFLDCVKSRREPYFPAEIGHRVSSVCHLGHLSMLLGRKLRWDPVREEFPGDAAANRLRTRASRAPWGG